MIRSPGATWSVSYLPKSWVPSSDSWVVNLGRVAGVELNLNTDLGGGNSNIFYVNPIWGRFPISLIFFKGVETTN